MCDPRNVSECSTHFSWPCETLYQTRTASLAALCQWNTMWWHGFRNSFSLLSNQWHCSYYVTWIKVYLFFFNRLVRRNYFCKHMDRVCLAELVQTFFCKIYPIVVYHIKTDIRATAVIHNKLQESCQYVLHVSVVLIILRHLNIWYLNLKIKWVSIHFKFMRPHKRYTNTLTLILWLLQFVSCH
jgi:hypothetical protein